MATRVISSSWVVDPWCAITASTTPSHSAWQDAPGRAATVLITGIALALAFLNRELVFDMVAYAWSGLGSSFGPVILLALWWKRMTRGGAMAGMVTGMASTILWRNVAGLQQILDIKAASFILSMAAVVVVSLMGNRTGTRRSA